MEFCAGSRTSIHEGRVIGMDAARVCGYDGYVGLDVGKGSHAWCLVTRAGGAVEAEGSVPSAPGEASALAAGLARRGRLLAVVDQPGGFAAPLLRELSGAGIDCAYVAPGRFAEVAGIWGEDKTDAGDARVLARMAVPFCALLREAAPPSGARAELAVAERTAAYNRLHDALATAFPEWERVLRGQRLHSLCALGLLSACGGPASLSRAGAAGELPGGTRGARLAAELLDASRARAAAPGEDAWEGYVAGLATRLLALEREVAAADARIAGLCGEVEGCGLLRGIPGVGAHLAAVIALAIGDVSRFDGEAGLAAHAALGELGEGNAQPAGRQQGAQGRPVQGGADVGAERPKERRVRRREEALGQALRPGGDGPGEKAAQGHLPHALERGALQAGRVAAGLRGSRIAISLMTWGVERPSSRGQGRTVRTA